MENSANTGGKKDLKQAYRTAYLIAGFLKDSLSLPEKKELDEWIVASEENTSLFVKMTDKKNLAEATQWFKQLNVEEGFQETKSKLAAKKTIRIWPWAVAASIALIIFSALYFFRDNDEARTKPEPLAGIQDIQPGTDKAILKLADGTSVELGKEGSDTSIGQNAKILRTQATLVYENTATEKEPEFHTLSVPRKAQYRLLLPDGTKVWINSESSIRYPVSFDGDERKVFVTGEAYFEVAKDKQKPFRVSMNDVTVEALGTEFNVSSYADYPYLTATLLEGSVLVYKGEKRNILKPGQQAQVNDQTFKVTPVDTLSVTGWKNGSFVFIKTPVDLVMRQLERWYDVEIVFEDPVDIKLTISIERDVPISKILALLEKTKQISFTMEGRKIRVKK